MWHESAVTDSSPETGEVSKSDGGVDKTDFRFPFSPFRLSHATRRAECGGDCREDGDYDVEDLAPGGVVVECSHNGKDPSPCPPLYEREYVVQGG